MVGHNDHEVLNIGEKERISYDNFTQREAHLLWAFFHVIMVPQLFKNRQVWFAFLPRGSTTGCNILFYCTKILYFISVEPN